MRILVVFCLLLLAPGLYLVTSDYIKSTKNPDKSFTFSTIAEVWLDHDRAGFLAFRDGYITRPTEWEQDVLPYLNMKAAPLTIVPLVVALVLGLCAWLLGIGPFGHWTPGAHHGVGRTSSYSGRTRPSNKGHQVRYKRK